MPTTPLALLSQARARIATPELRALHRAHRPLRPSFQPGGDLDDASTLPRTLPAAAADGEIMLLCLGGAGALRMGSNLVLSFRAMSLFHMLVLAPDRPVCQRLWEVLPDVACVWWPSQWARQRPSSLYNDNFPRQALALYEARKVLLERLVLDHGLNVLHLDGDTVWFADPYPLFKSAFKDRQLVFQQDNPFANAGVFYVQNVRRGDGAAWVLEELNRRVARFTYNPESVRELPHSDWARAPFFANADEQANLNDIIASSLSGQVSFAGGVEFPEARFKERFAPRKCWSRPSANGCDGVAEARRKMADGAWARMLTDGGSVAAGRRRVRHRRTEARHDPHLCDQRTTDGGNDGDLLVPGNSSARTGTISLAPPWLFAHFPYGHFFDAFRQCHASSWAWAGRSYTEKRLCMPEHRVPTVMVHMAGLRQESWGRRVMMRAFGVWQDGADAVAPEAWVSARAPEAEKAPIDDAAGRRRAWTATGKLLTAVDVVHPGAFASMQEYDRFAARLLLLGLLLRRRVVMPPIACSVRYMHKALQARHLRGLEIGCGADAQCIWLPYPHHIDPWCSGIDFLYDIDYRGLLDRGQLHPLGHPLSDVAELPLGELRAAWNVSSGAQMSLHSHLGKYGEAPVLQLRGVPLAEMQALLAVEGGGSGGDAETKAPRRQRKFASMAKGSEEIRRAAQQHAVEGEGGTAAADQLSWLPLGGFRTEEWRAPLPRRVEAYLRALPADFHPKSLKAAELQARRGPPGLGLTDAQVKIVKTCLRSLSTSKE